MKPTHAPFGLAAVLVTAFALFAPAVPCPPCASPIPISVLPFLATVPGSYCVTQDLVGLAGFDGIILQSDRVEIDLGGFTLIGNGGASAIRGSADDVTVKNGRIEGWADFGIDAAEALTVEEVVIVGTGAAGISGEERARVERCYLLGCPIALTFAATVRDCRIDANLLQGIALSVGDGSTVEGVSVSSPRTGIMIGPRSFARSCTVTGAYEVGLSVGRYSIAEECIVSGAGKATVGSVGFEIGQLARAVGCAASDVETGMNAHTGALVSDARIDRVRRGLRVEEGGRVENSYLAECELLGISTAIGVSVRNSTVRAGGDGILTSARSLVEGCSLIDNGGDGLVLRDESFALHNVASANSHAGIRAVGNRSRIEGNVLDANHTGLLVLGLDNLSIGNRAAANTSADFAIPAHNPAGPVLNTSWWLQGSIPQANFKTPFP